MKKLSVLIFSLTAFLTVASKALATTTIQLCPDSTTGGGFERLCNITFGGDLFQTLITLAFIVASLVALAFLVYGGIRWITSGGDKAGVESARNIIVAALVGLVITFLAYMIINIIFGIFGLNFGNSFNLPSLTTAP